MAGVPGLDRTDIPNKSNETTTTTNHGQTMQSVETTGCIDNIASSLSTGLSVNPSVGSHTHAAHPLALKSCTMHITCTAHRARTSRTAHRSARHHIDTRSAHSHAHAPQPVRRQRGELSQNSGDRASHERRQGGRRLFILLSPSCASQHTSPLPETQARGTSTRSLASSTYMTHVLT